MDDREASIEELRGVAQPEIKAEINGDSRIPSLSTLSPQQPPRKRIRYSEPPIWAQSVRGRKSVFVPNNTRLNPKMNGKQPTSNTQPQIAPLPVVKAETNGHQQSPMSVGPIDDPSRILGPWEKTITNKRPQEQITKIVADWLFYNVVSRNDYGELASRGVEIEIEAKLGQLIDKETNHRYHIPVQSECVLMDTGRVMFKSSMTEVCSSPADHQSKLIYPIAAT
jgi:polynucleotide 5'-triphosphatase